MKATRFLPTLFFISIFAGNFHTKNAMKKALSLVLFCTAVLWYAQEGITFRDGDFKTALAQAKKEKKLIFMDAFAAWCGPCKLMEKNVFTQPAVGKYYNDNFINVRYDMEKGEGREIAQKYGVRSYPSFLFLNGDGEVVLQSYGYMVENDFLQVGREANQPKLATKSSRELFNEGEKNPELLLNMMRANAQTDYDFAKKVSERYFQVKKGQPLTRDEIGTLLFFLKSPDDANYAIFRERKAEIEQIMSPDIYHQFDVNIKISAVMEKAVDQTTGLINDAYFRQQATPLVGKTDAETALQRMKVIYYPTIGKFDEYEPAALAYYKNTEEFNPDELLKAAWIFSEYVKTPASLKKAVVWAEKAVMKAESTDNTFVLARLYAKTGNKEGAKMYAEQSISLAARTGADATAARQLLESL